MTQLSAGSLQVTFLEGSTYKTSLTQQGGGDLADIDPNKFLRFIYNFPFPTTLTQFNQILNAPSNSIKINIGQESVIGFREEVERNIKDGMTEFVIRSATKLKKNVDN